MSTGSADNIVNTTIPRKENALQTDKIALGVCYYPEHWPRELWASDLQRMKAAGIGTVRVAEFSWNLTEPREGVYTFDFWDSFLDLALEKDMKVIFCTPTATPPAWMSEKHPEILNRDHNGLVYHHGSRRQYNYNSPIYLEYVRRITTVLAEHYGKHPAIVGWQLDNELNCEISEFYSEADDKAFRVFLKEKYQTLEALNEAWGTVFWNQTYSDWREVHIPYRVPDNAVNPHEQLDYLRFISASCRGYAALQSRILRAYIPENVFITTNGIFGNLDSHALTKESLDFMTYDSYPDFAYGLGSNVTGEDNLRDRWWAKNLSEVRSMSPNFGIMEQQSGGNGWNISMEAPAPKPGQLLLWSMQSIAHGADYVSFFRWRTSTIGTEIYWHGILDYDNRDNRKLAEVKTLAGRLEKLSDIAGTRYQAAFALVEDYDNKFDLSVDRWHKRLDETSTNGIMAASQKTHTPMDILYLQDDTSLEDLQRYKVLFYPHPAIVTKHRADLLEAYVEAGGTLVLGARAGYKQENGRCVMTPAPGLLAKIAGTDVKEWTFLGPADTAEELKTDQLPLMKAELFVDIAEPADETTRVLATFTGDFYDGKPALMVHPYGQGKVYTLSTVFNSANALALFAATGVLCPWADDIRVPEECELAVRSGKTGTYFFILNYARKTGEIRLMKPFINMYTGESQVGSTLIPAFGVLVFKKE